MKSNFRVAMLSAGACLVLSTAAFAADTVTFAKDVAPILQEKCQECHRAGSMAPMSLVTYEETRPWAKSIRERVITRQMPPWHIDPTVGVQKFKNDMSLSQTIRSTPSCAGWMQGAPLGRSPRTCLLHGSGRMRTNGKRRRNSARRISSSNRNPRRCRLITRTCGGGRRPISGSPSLAGSARSKCVPAPSPGRKITHHAVAYLAQDDPDSILPGSTADRARARNADGVGHRQGLRLAIIPTPASCCCRVRRFPGTFTTTPSARKFATTSSSASGSIRKARSPSIERI